MFADVVCVFLCLCVCLCVSTVGVGLIMTPGQAPDGDSQQQAAPVEEALREHGARVEVLKEG
jgi:hypothetical protein